MWYRGGCGGFVFLFSTGDWYYIHLNVLNKKIERVSKCDLGYPKKRNKNKFGKVNLITYLCIGFKNKKSYEKVLF